MSGPIELQAVLARQLPAFAWALPRATGRILRAGAPALGGGLLVFVIVLLAGGAPSPLIQLAYIPIAVAAYRGGMEGGLAAAMVGAVMLGPVLFAADLQHDGETGWPWLLRAGMFMAMGILLGSLFSRSRSMTQAWREAAVQARTSHHEGMEALARAAEAKDPTTGDHLFRCRDLAGELATEMGMGVEEAGEVAWSAMLHDIGKLYVPDRVLLKPGDLTEEEWQLMRLHPIRGAELLEHGQSLAVARRIARWHHENLDGSGYPDGLRGGAIPIEARIVRVVDAWDAMTNARPYRGAMTPEQALEELRRCAGSQFDPELVELFTRLVIARGVVSALRPRAA